MSMQIHNLYKIFSTKQIYLIMHAILCLISTYFLWNGSFMNSRLVEQWDHDYHWSSPGKLLNKKLFNLVS